MSRSTSTVQQPAFGGTGDLFTVLTVVKLVNALLNRRVCNERNIRLHVDSILKDLHLSSIIDDQQLEVARLTVDACLKLGRASLISFKARRKAEEARRRYDRNSADLRAGRAKNYRDATQVQLLTNRTLYQHIHERAQGAFDALCVGTRQESWSGSYFGTRAGDLMGFVDFFGNPPQSDRLRYGIRYADAVFADLNAKFPREMRPLPKYMPTTNSTAGEKDDDRDGAAEVNPALPSTHSGSQPKEMTECPARLLGQEPNSGPAPAALPLSGLDVEGDAAEHSAPPQEDQSTSEAAIRTR